MLVSRRETALCHCDGTRAVYHQNASPSCGLGPLCCDERNDTAVALDEKTTALNNALAQIERQFGKGSIMKMGDFAERMAIDVISTGSIALDLALGVGGLPR